jgi:hypothetical protein
MEIFVAVELVENVVARDAVVVWAELRVVAKVVYRAEFSAATLQQMEAPLDLPALCQRTTHPAMGRTSLSVATRLDALGKGYCMQLHTVQTAQ